VEKAVVNKGLDKVSEYSRDGCSALPAPQYVADPQNIEAQATQR